MKLEFGMGSGVQTVELPEKNLMGVLRANAAPAIASEEEEVRRALREPVGSPRLREILHPGQTVAIITSDLTRPMPTAKVMPPLLDELYAAGIRPEDITLVFALGSHRHQSDEEKRSAWGMWSTIISPAIPAGPRRSCRAAPQGRPFSRITP